MLSTGLQKYEHATVDNFTTDAGIKTRKMVNEPWRKILHLATKRKVVILNYPELEKDESYVFACSHSFDEDAISLLGAVDRNVYLLQGTTDQTEHNPVFYAMFLNGMIYVNRKDPESRHDAVEKMERILNANSSVMLFPEGGYNNTENKLVNRLFSSPYILSKDCHKKVVPIVSFNEPGSDTIYIKAGEPLALYDYEKQEGLRILRDSMATNVYDVIEKYTTPLTRKELKAKYPNNDYHKDYALSRAHAYESQKWYNDVWDEELTVYDGYKITPPEKVNYYLENLSIDELKKQYSNADLIKCCQNNIKLQKNVFKLIGNKTVTEDRLTNKSEYNYLLEELNQLVLYIDTYNAKTNNNKINRNIVIDVINSMKSLKVTEDLEFTTVLAAIDNYIEKATNVLVTNYSNKGNEFESYKKFATEHDEVISIIGNYTSSLNELAKTKKLVG